MKFGIYALRNAPHFHVFTVREFRACRISYNRYMVLYNRHRKVSHTKIPSIILHKTKRNEDREKQQNPASRPDYNHCSRYRIVWHSHKTHKILWHNAEIFGQPPLRGLGNKNLKNDNLFHEKHAPHVLKQIGDVSKRAVFISGNSAKGSVCIPCPYRSMRDIFHIYKYACA